MPMTRESLPPDPDFPRYSTWPFPAYRFLPGQHPHPRRHPSGHSYGIPEPTPVILSPEHWETFDWYLYGIDLYNYSYWWESHEVFEALWHAAGHESEQGLFFRGIIQVAASNLKYHLNNEKAAKKLVFNAHKFLSPLPNIYMGLHISTFLKETEEALKTPATFPALIKLQPTNPRQDDRS